MQHSHLTPEEQPKIELKSVSSETEAKNGHFSPNAAGEVPPLATANLPVNLPRTEQGAVVLPQNREAGKDEALLTKLIDQARKHKRRQKISTGFYYSGMALFILSNLFRQAHLSLPIYFTFALVLLYASALVAEITMRLRWSRSVASIANIEDIRAVGTLAEAMDIPDTGIRSQAQAALTRLLPHLKAEDAPLLNERQRNNLNQRLKIEYALTTPDFMVATLEALERIGDAGALSAVQELAASTVTSTNGRRVQVAAKKCLPALRLRIRSQETSNTLLRASSIANFSTEQAVRAGIAAYFEVFFEAILVADIGKGAVRRLDGGIDFRRGFALHRGEVVQNVARVGLDLGDSIVDSEDRGLNFAELVEIFIAQIHAGRRRLSVVELLSQGVPVPGVLLHSRLHVFEGVGIVFLFDRSGEPLRLRHHQEGVSSLCADEPLFLSFDPLDKLEVVVYVGGKRLGSVRLRDNSIGFSICWRRHSRPSTRFRRSLDQAAVAKIGGSSNQLAGVVFACFLNQHHRAQPQYRQNQHCDDRHHRIALRSGRSHLRWRSGRIGRSMHGRRAAAYRRAAT